MCLSPRLPKDGSRWVKMVPRWLKTAQDGSRWPRDDPKMAQDGSQDGSRWPKIAQDSPKMAGVLNLLNMCENIWAFSETLDEIKG